ncbi:TonB-dependent receptor [Pseudomonas sp. 148P]|uniref:TonB-dependent receptor n=1 Tax=Pseudomonas ulcerans TaxID=3115852 RepID=A0ABU7HYB3_9PSED|nr:MULTISPECIES: TonB-dependent receptor [unclassified Pseudomonas]MEE1925156.1 TonB-dependent receptor [Pseudomonas sp. 147P]MEE1936565.1 TonB-dependent receptor [Pseudomonas sp. 148P]
MNPSFSRKHLPGLLFGGLLAAPAFADEPTLDKVQVVGARVTEASAAIGEDRISNTLAISHEALLSAPAGTSGLKMLEALPGFNVQVNDALGLYEFGNSVFVRAFNLQQIGFSIDGVPLGRSDQFGGSPIYRYVDNENTQRVTASTGAGDVTQSGYASLGPYVDYQTSDPAREPGASLSYTLGSDSLRRSFLRVETGEYQGLSAYVSRSKIDGDLWRGPGTIDREHLEAKVRYRFGEGNSLWLRAVHNAFHDFDSPYVSLAQYHGTANDAFGRSGRDFPYLDYLPDLPETVPGVQYSNSGYNQYYKQAINQRRDTLYSLGGQFRLSDSLSQYATLYYEGKRGYGVSPEAYATSLALHNAEANVPGLFDPKGVQYGLSALSGHRYGGRTGLQWDIGNHRLEAGIWAEKDVFNRLQARYNLSDGSPAGEPLLNEPVHRQGDFTSTRDSLQLHLKDTWALLDDRLLVQYGFKSLQLDYRIEGQRNAGDYIAGRDPRLSTTWRDGFLPQLGVVYNLTDSAQLFASYSENMALPRGADDIYRAASPQAPAPEAERAKNYELGWRLNRPTFNAAWALYRSDFDNRLQAFASPVPGSSQVETFYQNVGKAQAYGTELSGQWKPRALGGQVVFNGALTYNRAQFQDDAAGLALSGNDLPDSPRWLAQTGVTWEIAPWAIVNVSARYIGERYSNFTNTEQVPGYTLYNAYLDLGGEAWGGGGLKSVKLRFNVDNLFDKHYLGYILTSTSGPAVFRPGSPRTFQTTLSLDF